MTVTADVMVPATDFRLARTLTTVPDLRVEFEAVVPVGTGQVATLFVTGADPEGVRKTFGADPDVETVEVLGRGPEGLVVGFVWDCGDTPVVDAIELGDGTCLYGVGSGDGWRFRLRFPTRERLVTCYRGCRERGVELRVKRIRNATVTAAGGAQLTAAQEETLRTALETGFFDVPRQVTLQELAARLDVSDTATSQRLRRGLEKLLDDRYARSHPPGNRMERPADPG